MTCQGGGLKDVSLYNGSNLIRQGFALRPVLQKASLLNAIWQGFGIPVDEPCWPHIQIFQTSVLAASFTQKAFVIH